MKEQKEINQNNGKLLCFSIITGKLFEINEDEENTLTLFQLVLIKKPDKNCKKCYGRFHLGKNLKRGVYEICPSCLAKCIDVEDMKKRFGNLTNKK